MVLPLGLQLWGQPSHREARRYGWRSQNRRV